MVLRITNKSAIRRQVFKLDQTLKTAAPSTAIAVMRSVEEQLVAQSPVATGRFKASWKAAIDKPSPGVVGTKRQQREARGQLAFSRPAAFTGEVVWGLNPETMVDKEPVISNNLPYAKNLAEGYSSKAPAGWVNAATRAGVANWRSWFNRLRFNRRAK